MRNQIVAAFRFLFITTVLLGVIYPLTIWGVSQVAFSEKANGSLEKVNGEIVGTKLIGQNFEGDQWFHPRPSAAGDGYDASASSGSNLGPTNEDFIALVKERADVYREENGLDANETVPQDAVTASGSGLDPDISIDNARLQAGRIAKANGISKARVLDLIDENQTDDLLSFGGQKRVNVLALNISLEKLQK